jgi:hypothetical protein
MSSSFFYHLGAVRDKNLMHSYGLRGLRKRVAM